MPVINNSNVNNVNDVIDDSLLALVKDLGPLQPWLDFGSLLGLMRDGNPLLGGDLDLGTFRGEGEPLVLMHQVARAHGCRLIERRWRSVLVSVKIEHPVAPVDLHVYRPLPTMDECWTGTAFMPNVYPRVFRRAVVDARFAANGFRTFRLGGWPYCPLVWLVPNDTLGALGTLDGLPTPAKPLKLIQTHYGPHWDKPEPDWTWYRSHRSSWAGQPALAIMWHEHWHRKLPRRTPGCDHLEKIAVEAR